MKEKKNTPRTYVFKPSCVKGQIHNYIREKFYFKSFL